MWSPLRFWSTYRVRIRRPTTFSARSMASRAEQAVLGAVYGHRLVDAVGGEAVRGIDLPARLLFDHRELVGSIAVHLARRGEHEDGLRAMPARLLEQEHGGPGVDVEVGLRL